MTKKISVLICTNNRPRQLKSCLKSVLNQSIQADEILVLDASDKNYSYKIGDKIKYFKTKIKSVPYSRNFLLKKAKNNLCLFVDDDVILNKDVIFNCVIFFKEKPDVAVLGGIGYPKLKNNIYSLYNYKLLFFNTLKTKKKRIKVLFCPTMICIFQRKKLLKYKIKFDLNLTNTEDIDVCLRLREFGEKVYLDKRIKAIHEYRDNYKSLYMSLYDYCFNSIFIYEKYGEDLFNVKLFLGRFFRLRAVFYLFNFNSCLISNFSNNIIVNVWLSIINKFAIINAIKDHRFLKNETTRVERKK